MCRNHEVARFTYDLDARTAIGPVTEMETRWAPFGCLDEAMAISPERLAGWLSRRAVPMGRPGVAALLGPLGFTSTVELMLMDLGPSLSDQYWLRPDGFVGGWDDVSPFSNPFPTEAGVALLGDDEELALAAKSAIRDNDLLRRSPDLALNGNLPKHWIASPDGSRLIKLGSMANLMFEPYCEVAATKLCERVLRSGEFVPYRLEAAVSDARTMASSCPDMVDDGHELVPACDLMGLAGTDSDASLFKRYVDLLESNGIESAATDVEKMLAVDFLIGNFDRHWGNFGVIVETESRRWVRSAPLFDMGSSLWCDRTVTGVADAARRHAHAMPFLREPDQQLERYAGDLNWLDVDALDGIANEVVSALAQNPLAAVLPAYLEGVAEQVENRADELRRMRAKRR